MHRTDAVNHTHTDAEKKKMHVIPGLGIFRIYP